MKETSNPPFTQFLLPNDSLLCERIRKSRNVALLVYYLIERIDKEKMSVTIAEIDNDFKFSMGFKYMKMMTATDFFHKVPIGGSKRDFRFIPDKTFIALKETFRSEAKKKIHETAIDTAVQAEAKEETKEGEQE